MRYRIFVCSQSLTMLMNFLAHAFLSGDHNDILFGNFVADSIKGKMLDQYSEKIRQGVLLHRNIDTFTDQHPLVRQAVIDLRPEFGKFSAVVLDIYFDHYLALHWSRYSEIELIDYASKVYSVLFQRFRISPPRSKRILPYMYAQNWLVGYANFRDLERVFRGMSRRSSFESGMERAVDHLRLNHEKFEKVFFEFFPELIMFSENFRLQFFAEQSDNC